MEQRKENVMGTKPIRSLLPGMAFPIMLSMLVQALYNVVDSIFVAMLSENALASVNLVFPVQNLMVAVAVGTATGINALLSRRLGQKDRAGAEKVAENGVFITLATWLVFAAAGAVGSGWFLGLFTSVPEIAAGGEVYMRIVTVLGGGCFLQITFERILQSTGKTVYQMASQMAGAVINIILDPIMIFGLLGFPAMGVAGAALATVIGQWCGAALGVAINHVKNHEIRLRVKGFRPCWHTIGVIYRVGLPSIVMQSLSSVMVFGMNKILITFTETAVNVFGVYYKLQSFVFMPVFGVTNALVPIVGYNYGARKKQRITDAVRVATVMALAIMAAGTLVFELGAGPLLGLFNASPAMHAMGEPAFRIIALSFLPAAVGIVMSSVFQALGEGLISLVMSATRQLVFLLPLAFLLAKFSGLAAVWASIPQAEVVGFAHAHLFYRHIYNHKIAHIETVQFDYARLHKTGALLQRAPVFISHCLPRQHDHRMFAVIIRHGFVAPIGRIRGGIVKIQNTRVHGIGLQNGVCHGGVLQHLHTRAKFRMILLCLPGAQRIQRLNAGKVQHVPHGKAAHGQKGRRHSHKPNGIAPLRHSAVFCPQPPLQPAKEIEQVDSHPKESGIKNDVQQPVRPGLLQRIPGWAKLCRIQPEREHKKKQRPAKPDARGGRGVPQHRRQKHQRQHHQHGTGLPKLHCRLLNGPQHGQRRGQGLAALALLAHAVARRAHTYQKARQQKGQGQQKRAPLPAFHDSQQAQHTHQNQQRAKSGDKVAAAQKKAQGAQARQKGGAAAPGRMPCGNIPCQQAKIKQLHPKEKGVKNGAIVPVKALHGAGQKLCVYAQPHQGKHQRLPAAGAKQFGKQRKAEKACARRQHAQR